MKSEYVVEDYIAFLEKFEVDLQEWQKVFIKNLVKSTKGRAELRESAEGFKQIGIMQEVTIPDFPSLNKNVVNHSISVGESYAIIDDPLIRMNCDFASPLASDRTVIVVGRGMGRQSGKTSHLIEILEQINKGANAIFIDEMSPFPELPTPQIEDVYKFEKEEKKGKQEKYPRNMFKKGRKGRY